MNIVESIILGIIQGLTEFLPVSSSGHLVLVQHILGVEIEGVLLEIILHLGTLLAILIYYRLEIIDLWLGAFYGDMKKRKYLLYLFISILPIGFIGVFCRNFIELFFNPLTVCVALFINGIILASTFFITKKPAKELTLFISLLIGLFQIFALIPGISRSGITISIALALGLFHKEATKFSFFLAIPGLLGAGLIEFINLDSFNNISVISLIFGFLSSALIGYIIIDLLLKLISKGKFYYFSFYSIFLSILSYIYLV